MATILVVDDDSDIRLLTRLTLERDGHSVAVAADGDEALAAVLEHPPDLVVLDVMMPELDGYSVLRRMKEAGSTVADIPVIMLTALDGPVDRATGAIEGAVQHLTKPIDLDELRQSVLCVLAEPEAPQRKAAQRKALEMLARLERNAPPTDVVEPRPRLTGLERNRTSLRASTTRMRVPPDRIAKLTGKQRALLATVAAAPTVMEAAERLAMSRSNVYASLRRISRNLNIPGVVELLELARSGALALD